MSHHPYATAFKREGRAHLKFLTTGPLGREHHIIEDYNGPAVQHWAIRKLRSLGWWTGPNWYNRLDNTWELYFADPAALREELEE